jgi:hypothetical protein
MAGHIIQKVVINVKSEKSDDAYSSVDKMCLADWRWAANKGFWDCARQRWNEALGGMQAYLIQRNMRRAENSDRLSRRLERTRNKLLNPRRHLASSRKGEGTPDSHFFQAPSSGRAAYLHGSAGVDWFPPLSVDPCVGAGPLLDFMFRQGWGHLAVRCIWSAGFQAETVIHVFKELPPSLHTAITEAIDSAQMSAACAAKHVDPEVASDEITARISHEIAVCSSAEWEGDSEVAYVELRFDPETQVRIGAAANNRAASLLGLDRTELLARLEQYDVPLPLGPLEAVALFLHALSVARDSVDTCYHRLTLSAALHSRPSGGPACAVLVCRTTVRTYDVFGRLHKASFPPPNACSHFHHLNHFQPKHSIS